MKTNSDIKPYVSIVIPAYNVEKYIKRCIESCIKQTLKNIEIICVDDGSKDKTLSIIKSLAQKDNRIKVISKANSGYGNTMNVGMDNATGEYIGIVESDDYADIHMFEKLYNAAKSNDLDIVKSDYYTFNTDEKGKEVSIYESTCPKNDAYNVVIDPIKRKEVFSFQMNTWTGIYRTSFLRKNNIRHNETAGAAYQDNGFWFQTISLATSIMFLNEAFYHYRQDNPNSSINSSSKVYCMNTEYDFILNFILEHPTIKKEFMLQYTIKKFFNYMYTYERIAEEYKLEYLKRFSEEFNDLQNSKLINITDIEDKWIVQMINRITDDYRLFYYEDSIYRANSQLTDAHERLRILYESNELKIGQKLRKKILRKN